MSKKESIIYDLPGIQLKKSAIVDLNERNLLDKERVLIGEILDKICELPCSEEIHNKQLRKNVEIRKQVVELINLATTSCEHFVVRDILGAISFMLTVCTTDEYEKMPYLKVQIAYYRQFSNLIQYFCRRQL